MAHQSFCVALLLTSLLFANSFGASLNRADVPAALSAGISSNETSASSSPGLKNWTKNIWNSFVTNLHYGWGKVANGTIRSYEAVSSGMKGGWCQVANSTADTFEKVYPQLQESWGKVANHSVSTFETVSSAIQEGWGIVANGTVNTYERASKRIKFIFSNLYCQPNNETEVVNRTILTNVNNNVVTTTAAAPITNATYDDGEAIQGFACIALKIVKVVGISIGGGFIVALAIPSVFFLVLFIIGFTFYGNCVINLNHFQNRNELFSQISRRNCWIKCHLMPIPTRNRGSGQLVFHLPRHRSNWPGGCYILADPWSCLALL